MQGGREERGAEVKTCPREESSGTSLVVEAQNSCDLCVADRAVAVAAADLSSAGKAEEIVTAGDEGCADLPVATREAGQGGTSLGQTGRVLRRDCRHTLTGVGLPRAGGARGRWSHVGQSIPNLTEIKDLVREGNRGRHGCRGGRVGCRLLSLLAQTLSSKHSAGEGALPRGLLRTPVRHLHALHGRSQRQAVGRTGAEASRELEHLLRGPAGQLAGRAHAGREHGLERGREEREVIGFIVRVEAASGAQSDVALDLPLGSLDVLRSPSHFEARLPVSGRCHYVSVGDLLDALDCCTFRAHDQTDHSVRDPHEDGDLILFGQGTEDVGWRAGSAAPTRRTDLREVLRGGRDLSLGCRHVLGPSGDDKDGLLATHRRLYVRVRLGSKCLDLAACRWRKAVNR